MKTKIISMICAVAVMLTSCSKENELTAVQNSEATNSNGNTSISITSKVSPNATINAGTVQQYIRGFGGANIRGWIADLTTDQRVKAFSTTDGIGLSVLRVRISPNSSNWAAEKATIDAAKSYGASIIASSWTAPASMKDNNNLIAGKLNSSSYAAYAQHLKDFNTAVGGVMAISPSNEPNITVTYESMKMTAPEVASFVAAQGTNCGTKIMAPEPYNMDATFINSYLSNATAKANTSYIAGHIYGVNPSLNNFGKEVWMTEHITDTNDANIWTGAMNTAKEIHDCMNVGYSMYTWWYIRRSYGLLDESGNVTKRGYAMTHFAKWIRPGYNKISCTANPTAGVYLTAYKSGTKMVVVAINTNTEIVYQPFSYSGITVTGFNRYKTTSTENLVADTFTVSGGSFAINLPASSITTLVSK
ncbi:MAG: glucuronoarabinoxylan endo,4-beta-xylanase [Bacteroidota bacterium]|nr:glucuronoarabinoxylan endo,4-beta-xylanase [Bacteroidota bacterium]